MNKILEESGSVSSGVGRMGHGFGLQLTEPPSNMLGDNTALKKDMTITIEPVFEFESGKIAWTGTTEQARQDSGIIDAYIGLRR